jgi:SAM-dependent methyltransferase
MATNPVERLAEKRASRWYRWIRPPLPLYANPRERRFDPPLGRWNLYIGGAGSRTEGYVNLDLYPLPGVTVAGDAEQLPFLDGVFERVECDAVLEHTPAPARMMAEIRRCLRAGGWVHVVTPFCHPFHEYPRDYWRFTPDGLRRLVGPLEVVASGWRTGPTATLLVFLVEYLKLWAPSRPGKQIVYLVFGWLLFPLRYLDWLLLRKSDAGQLGNHCYLWARKAAAEGRK